MKIENNVIICFDTNIYDSTKYNFDHIFFKTFKNLKSDNYPNLEVYVEPIIYNEVLVHLREKANEIYKKLEILNKEISNLELFNGFKKELENNDLENEIYKELKEKFDDFIKFFSDKEIDTTFEYDITEILKDYFNGKLPFEDKKSKKSEFPDALIIQKLYNKFYKNNELIIVSNDKGFTDTVREKIKEAKVFKNYSESADYLNRQQVEYNVAHKRVENLIDRVKKEVKKKFKSLFTNYTSINNAKNIGFIIDVNNYNHNDDSDINELDKLVISDLDFTNYKISILNINNDKDIINAIITFIVNIDISGYDQENYYNIMESHKIEYLVNIVLESQTEDNVKIIPEDINLSRYTLQDKNIIGVYEPILSPTSNTYTIECENCGEINEYDSPPIDEFGYGSDERSMGCEDLYFNEFNENCQNCNETFTINISISIYPYLTLNNCIITCENGEIDLSYDLS